MDKQDLKNRDYTNITTVRFFFQIHIFQNLGQNTNLKSFHLNYLVILPFFFIFIEINILSLYVLLRALFRLTSLQYRKRSGKY